MLVYLCFVCVCLRVAVSRTCSCGLPLNKLIKEQTLLQTNQKITSQLQQDDPRTDKQVLYHIQSEHTA